jgi:DnaJ domain
MLALAAGLLLFLLLFFGARFLADADPGSLARTIRRFAWAVLFVIGAGLLVSGLLIVAIPLAAIGYFLLRRQGGIRFGGSFGGPGLGGANRTRQRRARKSFVRTQSLEMELDHDTGTMDGRCLCGRYAGRSLSSMSLTELRTLAGELQHGDAQEAALIQAYLDQRAPGWRTDSASSGGGPGGGANNGRRRSAASGQMSVDEAYEVLGLSRSATEDDIRTAHRKLMKKVHPDQGGSTYLAARINEAKEVLLSVR